MPGQQSLTPNTPCDGQIKHAWVGDFIVVPADPGDFTWDIPGSPAEIYLKRGKITKTPLARKGEEAAVTFGYSAYLLDIGDAAGAYKTLADAIWRYENGYADKNLTSTLANTDLVTCTTTYTISGTATGEPDRSIIFSFCDLKASGAEGRPNTIAVTGTSIAVNVTLA